MSQNHLRNAKFIFTMAAVWTVAVLASTPASAGSGTFKNGKYNFCVSIRFDASDAQLTTIRDQFEAASHVFADATDGQQRFGRITMVEKSGASNAAEYWIKDGSGGASATYDKYGVRGEHVMMFMDTYFGARLDTHNQCPAAGAIGSEATAYTIAHEHAHHVFGLADEYKDASSTNFAAECADEADTASLDYSIMENYYCRGGRASGGDYTLNEFCVDSNHNPDGDNLQTKLYGESTWKTIASHSKRSAKIPMGTPTAAPPAAHTVDFVEGSPGRRMMLVLDRSGSMSFDQRIQFAKSGAKAFVDFLANGDSVGIASFASSASINFALTEITGAGTQASAKTAIDALSASGATNIGGGLLAGLGQITSQQERSCSELIVLLSDGDHNTGTPPATAISQLQDEGVTAFTVGVGGGISTNGQATLQKIATDTGGRFFRVARAGDLVSVLTRLSQEAMGNGLLAEDPLTILSGSTLEVVVPVETGAVSATFTLSIVDGTDDIELVLRDPDGNTFTEADASTNPHLEFISSANSLAFVVQSPLPGNWAMEIHAGVINTGIVEAQAFVNNSGVDLLVSVQNNEVVFPNSVIVEATPKFTGENIIGAKVSGTVLRPDGSVVGIELFDDGLSPDVEPNDGIYRASFSNYVDDGTYTFNLMVENTTGHFYEGEGIEAGFSAGPRPAPLFRRLGSATAVVTGVPDFIVALVEIGPETLNLKSKGKFVTTYIELPKGSDPNLIDVSTVAITTIDGIPISHIPAETKPTEIGDFDNDGTSDLMVKFKRNALQQVLTPGMRNIRVEGLLDGQLFIGDRAVGVIMPGKGPR